MLQSAGPDGAGRKRLLQLYGDLSPADRENLLAYAAFLVQRGTDSDTRAPVGEPAPISRPEQESVIQAMRRLTATYAMVEGERVLNEAAGLMGAHIMQGREAAEVIDDLEALFEREYRHLLEDTE